MGYLVVYYSRSGNTQKVGKAISRSLRCREDRIFDRKDRSGAMGFITGGWDAWRGKTTDIYSEGEESIDGDHLIIGTPVWAGNPAPAVRTYLKEYKDEIGKVSFFCTMGGSGHEKAFQTMSGLCGKEPERTLAISEKEVKREDIGSEVKRFIDKIS